VSDAIPRVLSEGEVQVLGVTIKVFQLSNGQRVVEKEGFDRLLSFLDQGERLDQDDVDSIMELIRGSAIQ
jgi:cyclopropane fatty-acyl-phospholipid synthase-like methyltransferase